MKASIEIHYKLRQDDDDCEQMEERVKLFGQQFIQNNKDKCKIIYKDKEYELVEYLDEIEDEYMNVDLAIIKLKIISEINDISFMFNECNSLISLPDITNLNCFNITNMCGMFSRCETIKSIPDISNLDTKNVKYISYLFWLCRSLISLPDISKWDTSNVIDMEWIFDGCSSLITLPDISKWNTKNVKKMGRMFNGCSSLVSLPDISKWNISNVNDYQNGILLMLQI